MKKKVQYEVSYEVICTIEYLKEKKPGEHHFLLKKEQPDGLWKAGEDRAIAFVKKGEVFDVEGCSCIIRDEEEKAIRKMMAKILK
jgi:hypothetical protein